MRSQIARSSLTLCIVEPRQLHLNCVKPHQKSEPNHAEINIFTVTGPHKTYINAYNPKSAQPQYKTPINGHQSKIDIKTKLHLQHQSKANTKITRKHHHHHHHNNHHHHNHHHHHHYFSRYYWPNYNSPPSAAVEQSCGSQVNK